MSLVPRKPQYYIKQDIQFRYKVGCATIWDGSLLQYFSEIQNRHFSKLFSILSWNIEAKTRTVEQVNNNKKKKKIALLQINTLWASNLNVTLGGNTHCSDVT